MPAKGKSKVTAAQRKAIAAGRAAGKTSAKIAEVTGLSESTVKKQAIDPRTVTLMQQLKAEHEPQIRKLFARSLDVRGKLMDDLDGNIRARGVRLVDQLLTAGEPPLARLDPAPAGSGDFTLEELLVVYRRVSAT